MRTLILAAAFAALIAGCSNSDDREAARPSTPDPTNTAEPAEDEALMISDLIEANAEHYAFGCVYSYDFTVSGWTQSDIAAGLPVPVASWSTGTIAEGYVTLYDAASAPPNATQFTRIEDDERVCFVPE